MNIDFAKTKYEVREYLQKTLARLSAKHPTVRVKKLILWGYGFGKIVHVRLETSDDKAVFGGKPGEYDDDEFGRGVSFQETWPDFYAAGEDESLELALEDGSIVTTSWREGNDAIDKPFFNLLKEILREADLTGLNKMKRLQLSVEMGSSPLEETWIYRG